MAYFTPYIDGTGLHIPTYNDIKEDMIEQAKLIYGQDIYLGNDSQDYQYISSIASKVYDSYLIAQQVYNNRGPSTAIGSGLDIIVKLNGIKRDAPIYSTCKVNVVGVAGTVIENAIIENSVTGTKWNLPSLVTIGAGGSSEVTATCQISGPITAQIGELSSIVTPTFGWTSVNNAVAAVPGANAESDSALRARQAKSTAIPSRSILEGLDGALRTLNGVSRVKVYENDTSVADANGIPAHSICIVIEGGDNTDIATTIYLKKGPGCGTHGDVTVDIVDDYDNLTPIKFYRPSYTDIDVVLNVKALSGYTSAITALIKEEVAAYLNSLKIGEDLAISSLWGSALSAMPDLKSPLFSLLSLTAARHGDSQGTIDIVTAFNEVTRGNTSYITVNVS